MIKLLCIFRAEIYNSKKQYYKAITEIKKGTEPIPLL